jgi:NarL family two-component system response regulator LiaR
MADRIRVLVVDDHAASLGTTALALSPPPGVELVAQLDKGDDVVRLCRSRTPDVVLMDLDLLWIDGIEETRRIRETCPQTKVVVLTGSMDHETIARALAAGACGYAPKPLAEDELVGVVHRAASGEIVMPTGDLPVLIEHLRGGEGSIHAGDSRLGRLTPRESDVLRALAAGQTANSIADDLGISPLTVQSHIKSILTKLGVHSKIEAVTLAWRNGLAAAPQTTEGAGSCC